jgi:hypothetical protein
MSGSSVLPNIDDTVPAGPAAKTADQRANWSATIAWLNDHDTRLVSLESADQTFLLLTGGTLTGPLQVPQGDVTAPGLLIGSTGVGLYSTVGDIRFAQGGMDLLDLSTTQMSVHVPVNMNTLRIINMGTPTSSTDAVTKGYVDTNFAPVALAGEVAALRAAMVAAGFFIGR